MGWLTCCTTDIWNDDVVRLFFRLLIGIIKSFFVISETSHGNCNFVTLNIVNPAAHQSTDAVRPEHSAVHIHDTVPQFNYGGWAIVHRRNIQFKKHLSHTMVTIFEYVLGWCSRARPFGCVSTLHSAYNHYVLWEADVGFRIIMPHCVLWRLQHTCWR
jgi:hypothetical protein